MIETSQSDRRTTTRRTVDLAAFDATTRARLRATDLSLGGARIEERGSPARPAGSAFDLELTLPEEVAPLRVRALVVGAGTGWLRVRFLEVRKRELVKLAEHLWS